MKHQDHPIAAGGICRPYGAGSFRGVLATKMPLLTELEMAII